MKPNILKASCGIPNKGGNPQPFIDRLVADIRKRRDKIITDHIASLNGGTVPNKAAYEANYQEWPSVDKDKFTVTWAGKTIFEYWPAKQIVVTGARPRQMFLTVRYLKHTPA